VKRQVEPAEVVELLLGAAEQAAAADEALWREEQAFWNSDPLMGAAEADERARREARVGAAVALRLLTPVVRPAQRPRQGRAPRRVARVSRRRRQAVARAGPRSDDPDEPDPPLGGPVEAGGSPPICPRCKTSLNVRRVPFVRGWSCRWCVWVAYCRQRHHDAERVVAEAERIAREAS
jgi:hypothetical protein